MKRALIALLVFFVVGSALAESPAKIRITTWNLEWSLSTEIGLSPHFFAQKNTLLLAKKIGYARSEPFLEAGL